MFFDTVSFVTDDILSSLECDSLHECDRLTDRHQLTEKTVLTHSVVW